MGWFLTEYERKISILYGLEQQDTTKQDARIGKDRSMIPEHDFTLTTIDGDFNFPADLIFLGYTDSIKVVKDFLTDKIHSGAGYLMDIIYMKEGHQIHRPMTKEEAMKAFMPNDLTTVFVDRDGALEDEEK